MDQKINAYLESLVSEVVKEQNDLPAEKIRDYLYNTIFDMVIDRLNTEQLNEIKDLPMNSPEMVNKIQEFTAFMPNIAQDMEARLNQEVINIKQNPQVLSL